MFSSVNGGGAQKIMAISEKEVIKHAVAILSDPSDSGTQHSWTASCHVNGQSATQMTYYALCCASSCTSVSRSYWEARGSQKITE